MSDRTLELENERLKVFNYKLRKEGAKAQKALTARIWFSAVIIAAAIGAFTFVANDLKYECFQAVEEQDNEYIANNV